MDKFDQTFREYLALPPAEYSARVSALKGMCPCPGCPTYTECARNARELLFCTTGGSFTCITRDMGCICPACPVAQKIGVTHDRFCLRGSEMMQRYAERLR